MLDPTDTLPYTEFEAYVTKIHADISELDERLTRAASHNDFQNRRLDKIETQITQGFSSLHQDMQSLHNLRTWVTGGAAAAGGTLGVTLWHLFQMSGGHL